jgi:uncharacterized membrane protein YfcA
MEFDIQQILHISLIILLASTVQSAVGFAFALLATPLLIWIGIPLPAAITIVAVSSFFQAGIGVKHLYKDVPWKISVTATIVRTATVFIGILILKMITDLDTGIIRFIVGCFLTVLVILPAILRIKPVEKVHWFWGALAFSSSGVLNGMIGMGGPPLVLWALRHDWPVKQVRGFLFAVLLFSLPLQILMLYNTFGNGIEKAVLIGFASIPAIALGTFIGIPLGNRMSKSLLRIIVNCILLIIAASSIAPVFMKYCK